MVTSACVECGEESDRPCPLDGAYLCSQCLGDFCSGILPEHISHSGDTAVYWWHCVCGLPVRRGAYKVRPEWRDWKHRRYREHVEAVADAGVMLCRTCALAAGVLLPPLEPDLPANVVRFRTRCPR